MAWRITESVEGNPKFGSADIGALWKVKLVRDGQEAATTVEIARNATDALQRGGRVADETRRAVQTKGRSAVKAALAEGGDPPARIICSTDGCRSGA